MDGRGRSREPAPSHDPAEILMMIAMLGIEPAGLRRRKGPGRPAATYHPTVLQHAHAAMIRARVDLAATSAA